MVERKGRRRSLDYDYEKGYVGHNPYSGYNGPHHDHDDGDDEKRVLLLVVGLQTCNFGSYE